MSKIVDLEFAKKLKYEGYRKPCKDYYIQGNGYIQLCDGEEIDYNNCDFFAYSAPPVEDAVKWIINVKKSWVSCRDQNPQLGQRVDIWIVPEDEEKGFRLNNHVFKGSFEEFESQGEVMSWIPHVTPGIDFNNLRIQIAFSLDRIIKKLNRGILPESEQAYIVSDDKVWEGDLVVNKEDLQDDIDELRNDVLFLLASFDKDNPNFQLVYQKVKDSGGITRFNDEE